MADQKIRQGILVLIDPVKVDSPATSPVEEPSPPSSEDFPEKVKTLAQKNGFRVVGSPGNRILLYGTGVEGIMLFLAELFAWIRPGDRNGAMPRFHMAAHSGYFKFREENRQPAELISSRGIKDFPLEKYAAPGEVLITRELYQGIKSLLTPKSIEAQKLALMKHIRGFDNEEWFPPFYKLIPANKETGAANLLEQRMDALSQEVSFIPVFGNLYPPVPMGKNFIALSLLIHQDMEAGMASEKSHDHEKKPGDIIFKGGKRPPTDDWIFIDKREPVQPRDFDEINALDLYKKKNKAYTGGVIFGLPGAGKTTILRYIAHREFKANQLRKPNRKKLILFVPCRDIPFFDSWHKDRYGRGKVEPGVNSALAYMTWVFLFGCKTGAAVTPEQEVEFCNAAKKVIQAFRENRLTLLVDGLDEAPDNPSKERILELLRLLFLKNRVFLTSRPSERIHLRQLNFPIFNIMSLTMDQVRQLARQLLADNSPMYKKFDEALWQEEIVDKIPATPITALLFTAYFMAYGHFDHRYPMYDLLMKFILVKAWENMKTVAFSYKNLELFFEEIKKKEFFDNYIDAGVMYEGLGLLCFLLFFKSSDGVHRLVNEETLKQHFKQVIIIAFHYSDDKAAVLTDQWLERFRQDHLLLQVGTGEYVFMHSTIMEYLAAYYMIQQVREDREKLPALVMTAIIKQEFLGLETIPIATGNDLTKGFAILTVLRDTRVKYKRELLYELSIKCLAEVEWQINNALKPLRLENLKKSILDMVHRNHAAYDWIYDHIKTLVLTRDKNALQDNIHRYNPVTRLNRTTLLEEYLDYDTFNDGDSEMVSLRRQLLLQLVQKQIVEEWERKNREYRQRTDTVLQLDYPGFHREDKNFGYFKKSIGRELAGFYGSPNMTHYSSVLSCVFSPDGKNFLASDKDGLLKIWDSKSGKEIRTLTGHKGTVRGCAFSPQGTRILSASEDKTLKLWDVESGSEISTLTGHMEAVWDCDFSPDGKQILSASSDNTLKLWDAGSGKEIRTLAGHKGPVGSCAFSPQGGQIISASYDNTLKLWDVESGKEIRTFTGHKGVVWGCAFSPEGELILSASHDMTLKLWDIESGSEIRSFSGHKGPVRSCAFSPDGTTILSASQDTTLKLWVSGNGTEIRTVSGHYDGVDDCAFSPDGTRILSASQDKTLKLWNIETGTEIYSFLRHSSTVSGCALNPAGTLLLSASQDCMLKLWDAASGKEIRTFTGHKRPVKGCAFSPDGIRMISASADKTLKLWETASGKEIRSFSGHKGSVKGCTFSPDGKYILSASSDKTLKLWDAQSGKDIRTFKRYKRDGYEDAGHKKDVNNCIFSLDGSRIISASDDRTLKLWDVSNGREILTFKGHNASVNNCVLSPDGTRILSASDDGILKLWEMESGKEIRRLPSRRKREINKIFSATGCVFSSDGKYLISTYLDKTLKLWDSDTGKLLKSLKLPFIPYNAVISPVYPHLVYTANQNGTLTSFNFSKYMQKPNVP